MCRMRLVVLALLLVGMMAGATAPASAQGYTGWIEHPYPSAGLWYCDWYGSQYMCMNEAGTWVGANPNWYDASVAEMMSVFGQPVL